MPSNEYCVAQICVQGHVITSLLDRHPEQSEKYCSKCGSLTIDKCPQCNKPIRGLYLSGGFASYSRPSFCYSCGVSFPWTQNKIKAAKEISKEVGLLSEQDVDTLTANIEDLIKDNPNTALAAIRVKKILAKMSQGAGSMVKEILTDVLSETAKKMIWS